MFARDMKRVLLFLIPTVVLLYLLFSLYYGSFAPPTGLIDQAFSKPPSPPSGANSKPSPDSLPLSPSQKQPEVHHAPTPDTHNELASIKTPSGGYFPISFGPGTEGAFNPNIIPHPTDDNVYTIIAQENPPGDGSFHEIACYAAFSGNGTLECVEPSRPLPIEPTKGLHCEPPFDLLDMNSGPHDGRVFWGPDGIYTIYGSNSQYGCFGQFIQNFAGLMDWTPDMAEKKNFLAGTELRRPGPHDVIEKNWFLFWDREGDVYAHYTITPSRSFAKLEGNGSVGADLAPLAKEKDDKCMQRLMPFPKSEKEHIHQATNSLAVTLCRRADSECVPNAENTVLFVIFHRKGTTGFHAVYDQYVLVFRQTAPFGLYGVGLKPMWIKGRGADDDGAKGMLFVTSIAWKDKSQRYHGYLDDALFLSFGIGDTAAGGIDVRAEDVLRDLGLCEQA